jgi:Ca2+/Na+ antiporter
MSSSLMIIEFTKSTQNVCMCVGLSMLLIICFMISPLNSFMLSSIFGKVIILTLLGYILYYNTIQTNKFSKNFNVNIWEQNKNWNPIKTNIICSYIFSLFVLVLIISVIRTSKGL